MTARSVIDGEDAPVNTRRDRDRGSALPLVLVISVVLAAVMISTASYATTNLRYGRIVEDRTDRLAAAEAGMRYAIEQARNATPGCLVGTTGTSSALPAVNADFSGATARVSCTKVGGGIDGVLMWAAVLTGEGVPNGQPLLTSQGGNSERKVLGGPVFMSRVTPQSFLLSPIVEIENGMLWYQDTTTSPCTTLDENTLPAQLLFTPDLIYGPQCANATWKQIQPSPDIPDNLSTLQLRDGRLPFDPLAVPVPGVPFGSYTDINSGSGSCRVFEPGWYKIPPAVTDQFAYFKSGEYVFDFPAGDELFLPRQGEVTAGVRNPVVSPVAELTNTDACRNAQAADKAAIDAIATPTTWDELYGATFYLAGPSRIEISTQGSWEINARRQGNKFVSVQTLCNPATQPSYCTDSGDLLTPSTVGATTNIILTSSGNNRELVAHGQIYAPLARMEFGNVTNTATQKLLGGVVVSNLVLQSSASATNFEIAVPTTPINIKLMLTSTATKNGTTTIRAVIDYRPFTDSLTNRVAINSWRVCETAACT
jgi:hypothetical protein